MTFRVLISLMHYLNMLFKHCPMSWIVLLGHCPKSWNINQNTKNNGYNFRFGNVLWINNQCFMMVILLLTLQLTICQSCYVFPPGKEDPCKNVQCNYGAICVSSKDGKSSRCQCQERCDSYGDNVGNTPICGNDKIDYNNFCELQRASCKKMEEIKVKYYGKCDPCDGFECTDGQTCQLNKERKPECLCDADCGDMVAPVCGSDGQTYNNECLMRMGACKSRREITVRYMGECSGSSVDVQEEKIFFGIQWTAEDNLCETLECGPNRDCTIDRKGRAVCMCPVPCEQIKKPVCGSDGQTYENECELRKYACEHDIEIKIVHSGKCETNILCKTMLCGTGAECVVRKGQPVCECPACTEEYDPVCGKDGMSYMNMCKLKHENCVKNRNIEIEYQGLCVSNSCEKNKTICQYYSACEFDGETSRCVCPSDCSPVDAKVCGSDGVTYQNECELRVASCRMQKTILMVSVGQCDECQCNTMGSLGTNCDSITKQCKCKDGVGGQQCNRCLPGYWGLHLIQEKQHSGCVACGCHKIGSQRDDCQQMTGHCVCKRGYIGTKCDRCEKTGKRISEHVSCDTGEVLSTKGITPPALTTKSRKTTRHIHTKPSSNSTQKPPINKPKQPNFNYGRIGDLCLDDVDDSSTMRCYIPNSVCQFGLCQCMEGYIPTYENTQCSAVHIDPSENTVAINADFNACTLNPCLNRGICQLDHSLGYRCLCAIGRSGSICKQEISFMYPSFSGLSFLSLTPIGNITDHFTLEIAFHSMNKDGVILFASENKDGTGQFISLAITNGQVELRFDMGEGPVIAHHPHEISLDSYHHVIIRLQGQDGILIQDNIEPVKVSQASSFKVLDLSGALYLGYIPQNLSYVLEKVGVNLGFVGCIQSLAAGRTELAKIYNMEYPNVYTDIKDGIHITPCGRNPCQSLPCTNGGTCIMKDADLFECTCPKGFTGDTCETALDVCTNNPCHHGATCSVTDEGEVICYCPDGREGQYCEYEKLERVFVPYFKGDSFMILPVEKVAKQMSIEVWFLTSQPNGMLLFASQYDGLGDFISLNIVERHVEFHFDLGSGPVKIRSSKAVTLNKWHRVMVHRMNREADLILDGGKPDKGISQQSDFMELQLSEKVYLGGYKDRFSIPVDSGITSNLTGAIQRLYINRLFDNLMNSVIETWHIEEYKGQPCNVNPCLNGGVCVPRLEYADCRCPKRYIGERCEKRADSVNTNSPVMFNGKTYLKYNNEVEMTQPAQKDNKFKLQFKTVEKNGLLLFQSSGPSILGDYLSLSVVNGRVEFSYNLGKQSEINIFKLRSTLDVGDGVWHTVIAYREKRHGSLQVDQEQPIVGDSDNGATQLDTEGILWIGGKADMPWGLPPEYYVGFMGCIGQVQINNVDLHLFDHRDGQSNTIVEFCN